MGTKRDVGIANLSAQDDESKQTKVDVGEGSPQSMVKELRQTLKDDIAAVSQKLGEMYVSHTETKDALQFHTGFMETVSTRLLNLERREKEREEKLAHLATELTNTKEELSTVKVNVKENTKDIKSNNMVINGLKESVNENCRETAINFLKKLVPDIKSEHISNAYRMGKSGSGGMSGRALFIKFHDGDVKTKVMKQKNQLYRNKNLGLKSVFCNDDVSEDCRKHRQELREIARYAKNIGFEGVKVSGDKLFVRGKVYTEEDLHLLPRELKMENIRTRRVSNGIGFFSKYSFLSNFHPAKMVVNGQTFTCSEQAFQYNKALVCNRDDIVKSVKSRSNPKKMKMDGDRVDTSKEWEERKVGMMRCILTNKFAQNPDLLAKLKDTGNSPLYECTVDTFWGTGWVLESPKWQGTDMFPGNNVLGNLLMEVRGILCISAGENRQPVHQTRAKANTTLQEIREDLVGLEARKLDLGKKEISEEKVLESNRLAEASGGVDPNAMEQNKTQKERENENDKDSMTHSSCSVNSSDIMEVVEESTLSVTSDDLNKSSFNARSIMLEDGHLDRAKMMGWALPALDTSRLREIAAANFLPTEAVNKTRTSNRSTHKAKIPAVTSNTSITTSTPITASVLVTTVTNRKEKKARRKMKERSPSEEKRNLLRMLDKLN